MEWDSTASAWDGVSKLKLQNSILFESGISTNNMFSVDLKLGRFEDMGDHVQMDTMKNNARVLDMTSSTSSSSVLSKRSRLRSNGQLNTVSCAVDGCVSDLSQCREYHRRHRVCERHSKTPVVLIGAREQRFCQQCSRFHSLREFDEAKRSCRKRLDGHNRRRRKTQPDNIYMANSGAFQTSHTGNGLLQFCSPDNWPVISEPQKGLFDSHHHCVTHPISSLWSTSCIKEDRRIPFVTGINRQTVQQPSSAGVSLTGNKPSSLKSSADRIIESTNSGRALSLLSRYPTQSSGICIGPSMQPMIMSSSAQLSSPALDLEYSLAQFSCSKGMQDESSASLSSTVTDNSQIFGGFQSGQDGFSENRPSRIFHSPGSSKIL